MTELTTVTGMKVIRVSGTSLTVSVTDLCRMLDLERGDIVEVTLRRVDDDTVRMKSP